MKTSKMGALAALVASAGLLVTPHASADQVTTYNPGGNNADFCSLTNGVLTQNGTGLQATGYVFGLGWNNGGCNGTAAPENTVALEANVQFWTGKAWQTVAQLTYNGDGNNQPYMFNRRNVFGIYFASIPSAGLISSGAAGVEVGPNSLRGPGYYQLQLTTWILSGGAWRAGTMTTPSFFANLPAPLPPPK